MSEQGSNQRTYHQMLIDGYKAVLVHHQYLMRIGNERGICYAINHASLTQNCKDELHNHLAKNKPSATQHQQFYKHVKFTGFSYWWGGTREGHEQRTLFLKHLIKQLEDEQTRELQKET